MKKTLRRTIRFLLCAGLLCFYAIGLNTVYAFNSKDTSTQSFNCTADPTWFSAPSIPAEVPTQSADNPFCAFYQFSWQSFAYLMAPSKSNPELLNFEDASKYYELEVNADGTPANSCDADHNSYSFFIRSTKSKENGTTFIIPERIGQAGGGATIYDQNQNVVYYDVRFSKNMCDVNSIKQKQNFPGGTTEIKIAWKVLGAKDDASKFVTIEANITPSTKDQPNTKTTKLGMIGFHIAVATPQHPEFIWATFEHNLNVPDCASPTSTTGWSFSSSACTSDLSTKDPLGIVQCRFNNPSPGTQITGTPTEICREYAYGSAEGDFNYDENIQNIKTLNANVQPYLTGSYSVLTNYFNVGALWVSNIENGSIVPPAGDLAQISNQRGSLRLANTVAETEYQGVDPTAGFVSNCFGCHNYSGTTSQVNNTTSNSLSHIFDDIAIGSGQCIDVQSANTINSQQQAGAACPTVCKNSSSQLKWNGQWTNQSASSGQQLPMTVCGCCGK